MHHNMKLFTLIRHNKTFDMKIPQINNKVTIDSFLGAQWNMLQCTTVPRGAQWYMFHSAPKNKNSTVPQQ